jgi:PAT family beta-lactamase induction signal transducer AmpG
LTLPSILVESRRLRLTLFTAAYVSQGVPIGLLTVALPAWLAEHGLSLAQIAWYQGIVGLPWGFKLIGGPLMDRFAFLPMGRRRPWILGAQAGLTLALLSLVAVSDPLLQLNVVVALAFLVNACAALQDVAVDGMAIDVLPEDERGRANAFMAFGQVAGFSVFASLCGILLHHSGLPAAAAVCALTVGGVFALILFTRERSGERVLPWSRGAAAARTVPIATRFGDVFGGLGRVLFMPMSLVWLSTELIVRLRDGVGVAVFPVTATQTLGYSAEAYSNFSGVMGVGVAVAGLAVGPLVDRFGAKTLYMVGIGGSALAAALFAATPSLWSSTTYVVTLATASALFGQALFVAFIAGAMTLCWSRVAASQFAIYMSLSNLFRSIGSWLFSKVAMRFDVTEQFWLMAAVLAAACVVLWFFSEARHTERLRGLDGPVLGEPA